MRIRALVRFNGRNPGDAWQAKANDAKVWIAGGYAEEVAGGKSKADDGPPADKAIKTAKVKK